MLKWIAEKDVKSKYSDSNLTVYKFDGATWHLSLTPAESTIWWFLHGERYLP